MSSSRLGMWVFSFPECNLRKKECLFKTLFFPRFATDFWPVGCFYHVATVIIKWSGNLGFNPPAATYFYCFRSVFLLSSSQIQNSCFICSPLSPSGFRQYMRVKRSVDFRMAPKKATKGKGVAAEPTRDEGWNTSKCSQSDLDSLVSQGLLIPRSVIQ